jgi:hypothetical protein
MGNVLRVVLWHSGLHMVQTGVKTLYLSQEVVSGSKLRFTLCYSENVVETICRWWVFENRVLGKVFRLKGRKVIRG